MTSAQSLKWKTTTITKTKQKNKNSAEGVAAKGSEYLAEY